MIEINLKMEYPNHKDHMKAKTMVLTFTQPNPPHLYTKGLGLGKIKSKNHMNQLNQWSDIYPYPTPCIYKEVGLGWVFYFPTTKWFNLNNRGCKPVAIKPPQPGTP